MPGAAHFTMPFAYKNGDSCVTAALVSATSRLLTGREITWE